MNCLRKHLLITKALGFESSRSGRFNALLFSKNSNLQAYKTQTIHRLSRAPVDRGTKIADFRRNVAKNIQTNLTISLQFTMAKLKALPMKLNRVDFNFFELHLQYVLLYDINVWGFFSDFPF